MKNSLMETSTKVYTLTVSRVGSDSIIGKMGAISKGISRTDSEMAMEFGSEVQEILTNTRGNTPTTRKVAMGYSHGRLVMSIKAAMNVI